MLFQFSNYKERVKRIHNELTVFFTSKNNVISNPRMSPILNDLCS